MVRSGSTFILASILVLSACGGSSTNGGGDAGPTPCAATPPTLATVQSMVFNVSCAISQSCHLGSSPQGDLNLESGKAYAQIVGRAAPEQMTEMIVKAGDPDHSYMMDKILNRNLPKEPAGTTPAWTPMPPPSGGLDQPQIDAVRCWIAGGAMNN